MSTPGETLEDLPVISCPFRHHLPPLSYSIDSLDAFCPSCTLEDTAPRIITPKANVSCHSASEDASVVFPQSPGRHPNSPAWHWQAVHHLDLVLSLLLPDILTSGSHCPHTPQHECKLHIPSRSTPPKKRTSATLSRTSSRAARCVE